MRRATLTRAPRPPELNALPGTVQSALRDPEGSHPSLAMLPRAHRRVGMGVPGGLLFP